MDLGALRATGTNQTPNAVATIAGVRPRGISFVVERETAQTAR